MALAEVREPAGIARDLLLQANNLVAGELKLVEEQPPIGRIPFGGRATLELGLEVGDRVAPYSDRPTGWTASCVVGSARERKGVR